ncbi:heterokaryon incompatibility protein-domain-containing protein, partial [Paraphoma chrysanthemicola]
IRLINCSTLQLEEFFGSNIPQYAILSHTWGNDAVSFADLPFGQSTAAREGFQKISFTCAQAIRDGLKYTWVDTCCIDKSPSSELSEAINSMFTWYRNSVYCYAYLPDVLEANMKESFSKSRWFTRGWTLQELLAPKDVIFYDRDWKMLGKRVEHAEWISEIAGIDATVLRQSPNTDGKDVGLGSFCVAKKMSWASHRATTRLEDMAYCLLGIFDVSMPLLYGEGDRAFLRLQEEIIRRSDDDSILAWGLEPEMNHPQGLISKPVRNEMAKWRSSRDVLASSPKDFKNCASLKYRSGSISPFTMTNVGLQIQLQLV